MNFIQMLLSMNRIPRFVLDQTIRCDRLLHVSYVYDLNWRFTNDKKSFDRHEKLRFFRYETLDIEPWFNDLPKVHH